MTNFFKSGKSLQNLALRSAGKRRCLEQDMLPVAMKLMEHLGSFCRQNTKLPLCVENLQCRKHHETTLCPMCPCEALEPADQDGCERILQYAHFFRFFSLRMSYLRRCSITRPYCRTHINGTPLQLQWKCRFSNHSKRPKLSLKDY